MIASCSYGSGLEPNYGRQQTPPPDSVGSILLVEDDPFVREPISAYLASCGYEILDAANGEEAILVARRYGGAIDLLLTDVVMPKLSGSELRARLSAERPQMKTVFMSGYGRGNPPSPFARRQAMREARARATSLLSP
jgi:CheY-like chemotaxis protein